MCYEGMTRKNIQNTNQKVPDAESILQCPGVSGLLSGGRVSSFHWTVLAYLSFVLWLLVKLLTVKLAYSFLTCINLLCVKNVIVRAYSL